MRTSSRKGFTLVELLVVIGIIALLISILLPSLNRARQAAIKLQCMSNLRSVGQGMMMYVDSNKGYLPYGWAQTHPDGSDPNTWPNDGNNIIWSVTIANQLGGAKGQKGLPNPWDPTIRESMAIFQCPASVVRDNGANEWQLRSSYATHPVAMSAFFWGYAPLSWNVPGLYKQVWLAKNGVEKCIVWDAVQYSDSGWTMPVSGNADNDQYWWGTFLIDEPEIWSGWIMPSWNWGTAQAGLNGTFAEAPGNRQGGGNMDTYRNRHMNNGAGNYLFGDWHVESFNVTRSGESFDTGVWSPKRLNFCVPYPVPGLIEQ